jgi:hypothetical protein
MSSRLHVRRDCCSSGFSHIMSLAKMSFAVNNYTNTQQDLVVSGVHHVGGIEEPTKIVNELLTQLGRLQRDPGKRSLLKNQHHSLEDDFAFHDRYITCRISILCHHATTADIEAQALTIGRMSQCWETQFTPHNTEQERAWPLEQWKTFPLLLI